MWKVFTLLLVLSVSINAQRDSKWAWSSNGRNQVNDQRNSRQGYERLEDFRDQYDGSGSDSRPSTPQGDGYYNNNNNNKDGLGTNQIGGSNGNNGAKTFGTGYNSNSFGPYGPQGIGAPNNIPQYGGQYGPQNTGVYNGYNNPNYQQNYGPGVAGFGGINNGYGPNRYPYNPYNNPGNLYNNPYNGQGNYYNGQGNYNGVGGQYNGYGSHPGVLVGPGGPTGFYNRPPAYTQNYLNNPLYGNGPYYGGNGYNPGFGYNPGYPNPIAFNSKAGAGIMADESTDESQKQALKKL